MKSFYQQTTCCTGQLSLIECDCEGEPITNRIDDVQGMIEDNIKQITQDMIDGADLDCGIELHNIDDLMNAAITCESCFEFLRELIELPKEMEFELVMFLGC